MKNNFAIYIAVGIYFISTSAVFFSKAVEWLSDQKGSKSKLPDGQTENFLEDEKLPYEWFLWAVKGKIHPDYLEYLRRKRLQKLSQTKNPLEPRMRQIRRFPSPPGW